MCFKQTHGNVCLLIVALIQRIPGLCCTRSQCNPVPTTASSRPPELLRFDVSDSKTAQENPVSDGGRVAFWADAYTRKHPLQTVPLPHLVVLAHNHFSLPIQNPIQNPFERITCLSYHFCILSFVLLL